MADKKRHGHEDKMDGETAIAFAIDRYLLIHPKNTWPEWSSRCTVMGYYWDKAGRYIVGFSITPKATNDAVSYFEVLVDPDTAETTVLKDIDLNSFNGEDLQGFDPSDLLPKTQDGKPG